jgi:hypothetical protein
VDEITKGSPYPRAAADPRSLEGREESNKPAVGRIDVDDISNKVGLVKNVSSSVFALVEHTPILAKLRSLA